MDIEREAMLAKTSSGHTKNISGIYVWIVNVGPWIQTMKEREGSNERSGERERNHFHKGGKYTSTEQAGLGPK